jgi:hypothetical protein
MDARNVKPHQLNPLTPELPVIEVMVTKVLELLVNEFQLTFSP